MTPTFDIAGRTVGAGRPAYIIAEVGFNNAGRADLGIAMIEAAAKAGVDCVKFQTYKTDELSLRNWEHFELVRHGEMDEAVHRDLAQAAKAIGVTLVSTPFSPWAVDVLEKIGVPAYKIASMDLTNVPLIRLAAGTGKPLFLSTGMGTLGEIEAAVEAFAAAGGRGLMLLHCVSQYPPPPEHANLRTMLQIRDAFGLPTGYSDHVLGNAVALAAVALGAAAIEKHFTTDKNLPGPDHRISADPGEMAALVRDARAVEKALGRGAADPTRPDRANARLSRRGLYAARAIPAGTVLTADMIKCVRPERGLAPAMAGDAIGRQTRRALAAEDPITLDVI